MEAIDFGQAASFKVNYSILHVLLPSKRLCSYVIAIRSARPALKAVKLLDRSDVRLSLKLATRVTALLRGHSILHDFWLLV